MPVRKIPKNYLTVTGSFASRKNGHMDDFESLLEKEFMLLLDFDERVKHYEPQPVTIPSPKTSRGYTPDVLVFYLPDPETKETAKPMLAEIKHTTDLARNAAKYKEKFALAQQYADERGWRFTIKTEVDIRTPRLANIKFLREYRNISPDSSDLEKLLRFSVKRSDGLTPDVLLSAFATSDNDRLYWLPIIWHAVVIKKLIADWDRPIDYDTPLRASEALQ